MNINGFLTFYIEFQIVQVINSIFALSMRHVFSNLYAQPLNAVFPGLLPPGGIKTAQTDHTRTVQKKGFLALRFVKEENRRENAWIQQQ